MDTQKLRELLDKRDEIDADIAAAVGGKVKERKPQACSKCGSPDHTARNCTQPTI